MTYSGVFATPEEIESINRASTTPLVAIHVGMPESPQQRVHRYALAHGLPEVPGYYGIDMRPGAHYGEFVSA